MNEEKKDFAAKLELIEREAKFALKDLAPGVARERLQHIATLANTLRARLDLAPNDGGN